MIELSIVIATYNRDQLLKNCLDSLGRQTQSHSDYEVIVVIDGSTDETVEMLKNYDSPYLLRTVWQENSGQASALNRGIQEAHGIYCLLLDDDMLADPQLVSAHLQAQQQHENAVVIGQITLSLDEHADWYTNAFAQGWKEHYERLNMESSGITWQDCYSGNMSARRDALLASGGFSLTIRRGYDVELARRLEKQGCSLMYAPNALACQHERKGFKELSRDAENAGRTDLILYNQDHQKLSQALGSFAQGSWRKFLLHRFLLTIHVPPRFLEVLGRFMKSPARRYSLYSLIQKYCYWRGVRQAAAGTDLWHRLISGTPILMFHAIGALDEPATPFVLPVNRFKKYIAWLKRLGYHPISLEKFLNYRQNNLFPPALSVVITFDDGYADNYSLAYPILSSQDIPATIFIVSDYIGQMNRWDNGGDLDGRPLMSWPQIHELASQGIQIGAHSCTHPALTKISASEAQQEITGSRKDLESKLGRAVKVFAYPYGESDPAIQNMTEQAGFVAGCTADAGLNTPNTPSFVLRRTEVRGDESIARFFLALLTGDAEAFGWRRTR